MIIDPACTKLLYHPYPAHN